MNARPCVFGEVLFDHFPDGRRVLGGAPFNVAWHLQAFGVEPHFVSRIGNDTEGGKIREAMREWGLDITGMQTDSRLPSGRVHVLFDDGEPSYEIVHPAAWDAIEAPAEHPPMDLLYHGSLALRDATSRMAWKKLRDCKPSIVFVDVNLRSPWWHVEQVMEDIQAADWVKLNQDELNKLYPGTGTMHSRAEALLSFCGLQGLIVTSGEHGAEVLTAAGERIASRPPPATRVVDTVGAGDALASVMALGLLLNWPLDVCLERGLSFASAIVGRRGATVSEPLFYAPFVHDWSTTHTAL